MALQFDPSQARRFLSSIMVPGACFEIRILSAQFSRDGWIEPNERFSSTLAGWYDDLDAAIADLGRLNGVSAYVTPNPVKHDLIGRSCNRVVKSRATTNDEDIADVRWLYIDIDAERPTGISATDRERSKTIAVRGDILENDDALARSCIYGTSGNGAWILARINPIADIEEARRLSAAALAYLGHHYSGGGVKIDATTRNPARVMAIPGTLKCKGSHIPDRPHRLATIDSLADWTPEPFDLAAWVAAHPAPEPPKGGKPGGGPAPVSPAGQAEPVRRAAHYLAGMAPAVSGQGGHNQTFDAACALVKGFALTIDQARPLLLEWNKGCQPPWADWEIEHKLTDAAAKPGPVGYLLPGKPLPGQPAPSPGDPPKAPDPAAEIPEGEEEDAHRLARLVLGDYAHPESSRLHYWRDECWTWDGAAYSACPPEELRAVVTRTVAHEFDRIYRIECEQFGALTLAFAMAGGEGKPPKRPKRRSVGVRLVNDVLQAIRSIAVLNAAEAPDQPAWIGGEGPWEPAEVIPAANGLVHLPSFVDGLEPWRLDKTPAYFNGYSLSYPIEAAAPEPVEWLAFLQQLWPDDPEVDNDSIMALQEWFGYLLTPDTSRQKMLLLIGPPRSGKGTIVRVLRSLLGESNVVAPTLSQLSTNFGVAPLIGKPLAVITDCRIGGRADKAAIVERLLSISGEDPQTIDRKYKDSMTVQLPTRIMIVSNETLSLRDSSGALMSRFLTIELTRSFLGKEDRELFGRLTPELPGILQWAIQGWRRLRDSGAFTQPNCESLQEEMEEMTSPIKAFMRDRCITDEPDACESAARLYCEWKNWHAENESEAGTQTAFGRAMRSAAPSIRKERAMIGGERTMRYVGIRLMGAGEYRSSVPF